MILLVNGNKIVDNCFDSLDMSQIILFLCSLGRKIGEIKDKLRLGSMDILFSDQMLEEEFFLYLLESE